MTIDEYHQQYTQELAEAQNQLEQAAALKNLTPQQAVDWIENNVNDLASAKHAMKFIVRILIVILRRIPNL